MDLRDEKKIIAIPFAYNDKMQTGENIQKQNKNLEVYLKNVAVSTISAKHYNPRTDVALVTNLERTALPNWFVDLLNDQGVLILTYPFDCFLFGEQYKWGLAFYKICALKHLVEESVYNKICYFDADVYIQNSCEPIFTECDENIMLFDIEHGLNDEHYLNLLEEFRSFDSEIGLITHWGGEFFAATKDNAEMIVSEMLQIYEGMLEKGILTSHGDEYILSLAANRHREKIKNSAAYIYRYWTGARFRLVSTNYVNNSVCILHLPAEKEKGITKIFDQYIAKNKIPKNSTVWKICRISQVPIIDRLVALVDRYIRR